MTIAAVVYLVALIAIGAALVAHPEHTVGGRFGTWLFRLLFVSGVVLAIGTLT